ncbi:uncharacterized protein Dwil_GK18939 [Drosophila willistoni]|uniref:Uncharacterized protein n=1 Tax=Drosophila willistoni TaxID=7260 RepID=B4NHG3_DROWI|nr:uncharacterized protein LOC6650585 [Drosophila willistoni]EDW84639.1 uncharacterized protein Dwil_GK18939 [Drosophila willistoni]
MEQIDIKKLGPTYFGDIIPKCVKHLSTTKADYVDHSKTKRTTIQGKKKQTDPSLISGHYAHNLKVDGQELKTLTWPTAMDWREEYRQYLLRMKWCNEDIYKLFFVCPPVKYDQIEQFLKDLHKTVYIIDYSPDEYVSLKKQKNVNEHDPADKLDFVRKDYQTTYGNYYNRLQDLAHFKEGCYPTPKPKNMSIDTFEKTMRKLFRKYDLTTYYEELCLPALMKAKDGIMPSGPIDRYTLRKY